MIKNTFDLKAVSPEAGPQFSSNLHAWLRKNYRRSYDKPEVFRSNTPGSIGHGDLYIGHMHDGELIGTRLYTILTKGARATVFCFTNGFTFRPVPSFWKQYVKLGRCHIDPKHRVNFTDKRWKEGTRQRTCLWCGLVQKKVTQRRVVVEKVWVAA